MIDINANVKRNCDLLGTRIPHICPMTLQVSPQTSPPSWMPGQHFPKPFVPASWQWSGQQRKESVSTHEIGWTTSLLTFEFQSAPPCGGERRPPAGPRRRVCSFNPRPHAGANSSRRAPCRPRLVSIRAPMRGRTPLAERLVDEGMVSIRAPMRGRTVSKCVGCRRPAVSIRAPMRGRTPHAAPHVARASFQSAPPCGGELGQRARVDPPGGVSIRAPMRGRTPPETASDRVKMGFNPRPHAGANIPFILGPSTRPRFNPRPHAGANQSGDLRVDVFLDVSIRAPMRGRTPPMSASVPARSVSIRAPMRGRTPRSPAPPRCRGVSIRAPMRGRTRHRGDLPPRWPRFNPRPHAGANGRAVRGSCRR
jgi:hypothetical protein